MPEITEHLLLQAQQGNFAPLRALPKSDLHAHLLLSAPWATFEELAGRRLVHPSRFAGLTPFFDFIRTVLLPHCRNLQQFERLAQASLQRLLDDGVVLAELSVDLGMPQLLQARWAEIRTILCETQARAQAKGCLLRYDLGLARERLKENWRDTLREALELGIFSAVDIYGDELYAGAPEQELAALLYEAQVPIKVHSAEVGDAQSLLSVLRRYKPRAIQHGIRAIESAEALLALRKQQVICHVAPCSNIALGFVASYAEHPIRALYAAGVRVSLNTDDYSVFGRSLSEEYLALYTVGVFSAAQLEQIRRMGLGLELQNQAPSPGI